MLISNKINSPTFKPASLIAAVLHDALTTRILLKTYSVIPARKNNNTD